MAIAVHHPQVELRFRVILCCITPPDKKTAAFFIFRWKAGGKVDHEERRCPRLTQALHLCIFGMGVFTGFSRHPRILASSILVSNNILLGNHRHIAYSHFSIGTNVRAVRYSSFIPCFQNYISCLQRRGFESSSLCSEGITRHFCR